MGLAGKDLISINDFTNEEIESVLDLADQMNTDLERGRSVEVCRGQDMATLFYEPSTRTRGSFERAMHKLGGNVISFAEAQATSSAAKGETLADTIRVLENYADVIVIRHPWEGAARVAADYARVPVINAGDGAHEHPTQTLCDLYTIRKEKGKLEGLTVCLRGDLRYGRTVHSLVYALARFGAEVFCWPPTRDLDIPEAVLRKLHSDYGYAPKLIKHDNPDSAIADLDVLYIAPFKPYTHPLPWSELETGYSADIDISEAIGKTDVIYVTRLQTERTGSGDNTQVKSYPVMNNKLLGEFKKKPLIMHPLPRVNELAYELDDYPKSVYFREAAYGVPVRMALVTMLLEAAISKNRTVSSRSAGETCRGIFGVGCPNPNCISNQEVERRYLSPQFRVIRGKPLTLICHYCDHEIHPPYFASSEWHEGKPEKKCYHSVDSDLLENVKAKNLLIFGSESEAQAQGYKPNSFTDRRKEE